MNPTPRWVHAVFDHEFPPGLNNRAGGRPKLMISCVARDDKTDNVICGAYDVRTDTIWLNIRQRKSVASMATLLHEIVHAHRRDPDNSPEAHGADFWAQCFAKFSEYGLDITKCWIEEYTDDMAEVMLAGYRKFAVREAFHKMEKGA